MKQMILCGICAWVFASCVPEQTGERQPSVDFSHGKLKVSENHRFLQHEDGTPFFYLGDTAWELFVQMVSSGRLA